MLATLIGLAGAVFWLVVLLSTLAFRRGHRVPSAFATRDDVFVSVVVPANDEEAHLCACLRSLLAQTHRLLELIVVDDRSRDRTLAIARAFAEEDERVRVLHIDELPPGWTGKTNALRRGTEIARGEWLYFTDADTVHHSSALASLLGDAELERLDLLSGWPALLPRSPAVAAVDVLCASVLASWYRPRQGADARPAFANGQALLIRAATLAQIGGHEAVRSRLLEDVAIAEAVAAHGGRSGVLLLRDLVAVHSYPSVSVSIRSWSRILREGAHRRTRRLLKPAIALPLAAWSGWGAFLAGWTSGSAATLFAGLTAIAISTIAVGLAHADARAPRWPALLLPLAAIAAALALLRAARVGATNSDEWHGVTYPDRATDAPR